MSKKHKESGEVEDLSERVKGFNAEFIGLLAKYKLGLGAQPVFIQAKDPCVGFTVAAKPIIFDDLRGAKAQDTPPIQEGGVINPSE